MPPAAFEPSQGPPAAREMPAATKVRAGSGAHRSAAAHLLPPPPTHRRSHRRPKQVPLDRAAPLLSCAVGKWLRTHGKTVKPKLSEEQKANLRMCVRQPWRAMQQPWHRPRKSRALSPAIASKPPACPAIAPQVLPHDGRRRQRRHRRGRAGCCVPAAGPAREPARGGGHAGGGRPRRLGCGLRVLASLPAQRQGRVAIRRAAPAGRRKAEWVPACGAGAAAWAPADSRARLLQPLPARPPRRRGGVRRVPGDHDGPGRGGTPPAAPSWVVVWVRAAGCSRVQTPGTASKTQPVR